MSTGTEEFVLIQDDDGHWFVCPAEREQEAYRMLEAISRYWGEHQYDKVAPPEPDFLKEVGGSPSLVKFTGYRIG